MSERPLTPEERLRFMAQVAGDAPRTIICEPHRVDQLRALVDQMGLSSIWTVLSSHACPAERILILDEQAMQASFNQDAQRAGRSIRLRQTPPAEGDQMT
ncbi:hypothetical protein [Streptomyces olivaceiscleroticus]|uniref:Uncharacterized protein n=1 Tax=Streptomyces olivaceiscleroticus TaxID=68245 RepID=A0ABN1BNJ6_9ACTN